MLNILNLLLESAGPLKGYEIDEYIYKVFNLSKTQIETRTLNDKSTVIKKEIAWARQMASDSGFIAYDSKLKVWKIQNDKEKNIFEILKKNDFKLS